MDYEVRLTGRSPLLEHNGELVDQDHDITRRIAAITGKRKKTEEDRRAIAELEWRGGIYADANGRPHIPTYNVHKCWQRAAVPLRQMANVQRAVAMTEAFVPLEHDGPATIDDIIKERRFHHYVPVGIGQKRTMRNRPRFDAWALTLTVVVVESVMDPETFERIVIDGGRIEGLGDGRVLGFGRYTAELKEL